MSIIPQKRCTKCGETKPFDCFEPSKRYRCGYTSQCKDCRRAGARAWKARNKDKIRAYEEANREYLKGLRNEWRERNKERHLANRRAAYPRYRQYYQERFKRQYAENPDKFRKAALRSAQTPRGRIHNNSNSSRHRAWERAGDATVDQIQELIARQKRCAYCKRRFSKKLPHTIDHVIPLSKGGQHTISNLVLACKSCNSSKHNRMIYLL